jgi:hypothetical protein
MWKLNKRIRKKKLTMFLNEISKRDDVILLSKDMAAFTPSKWEHVINRALLGDNKKIHYANMG